MITRSLTLIFLMLLSTLQASAQDRLPIIDMHLHALTADAQGPPPIAMCTPIDPMPAWDLSRPFNELFMGMQKEPPRDVRFGPDGVAGDH